MREREMEKIQIKSITELMEMKYESKVKCDGKWITLLNDHGGYDIELSRCNTAAAILGWVAHLSAKIWVDTQMLGEFVRQAAKKADLKIY